MKKSMTLSILLVFFLMAVANAQTNPREFNFSGRLMDATGTIPNLGANVKFTFQIRSTTNSCVLYQEAQYLNLSTSNGYFSTGVGSEIGSAKRDAGDVGNNMQTVFRNSGTISGSSCSYSPAAGAQRELVVSIDDGINPVETLTAQVIKSIPSAYLAENAESVGGILPAGLLQVNTSGSQVLSQSNLESIFTAANLSSLNSLLAGSSPLYNKPATNGTSVLPTISAPTSPAAGQIWYNAGNIYYHDGTSTQTISTGAISTVNAANGSAAAPSISFSGDTDSGWYLAGADNLAAATGGVERVRINENGNLGLGSAAPGARLTLGGAMTAPAWTASGIGIRQNSSTYTDTTSSGAVGVNYVNAFGIPTLAASTTTTYTNASSFSLYPPTAGPNVTLTNSTGLTVNATGLVGVTNGYGMHINAPTGATNNYAAVFSGGNVGVGVVNPNAKLHLAPGASAAGTAPLKLTAGPVNTTAEAGAIEFDGTSLYYTDSTTTRRTLATAGSGITALTGEVTATGPGSVAATISNDAVTNAKMADNSIGTTELINSSVTFAKLQNIATDRILGRDTAAAGVVEELTLGTGLTITGGALALTDTTDDDSFAIQLGVCTNGFTSVKSGGVWTCVEATDLLANNSLIKRGAAGSFEANIATLNGLKLNNAGSQVTIANQMGSNYSLTLPFDDGSANQVLQTDGSGFLTWVTPAAGSGDFKADGTISMSGQLKSATGTNTAPGMTFAGDLDTGFHNTTANSVTFSTTGSDRFNFGASGITSNTTGAFALQNSNTVAAPPYAFNNDTGTGIFRSGAGSVSFSSSGNLKFTLDSVGAALIGDQYKLSTYGNGSTLPPIFNAIKYQGTSGSPAAVGSTDELASFRAYGYDGSVARLAGKIDFQVDNTPGLNDMPGRIVFSTTPDASVSPAERMRIDSNGYVGIGTSSPTFPLHVSAGNSSTALTGQTLVNTNTGTSGPASQLAFATGLGTPRALITGGVINGAPTGYLAFSTRQSNAMIETLRIDDNGNVGIRTSSPARPLHVNGPMRLTPTIAPGTPVTGDIYFDSADNKLKYHNGISWVDAGGAGDFKSDGSVSMNAGSQLKLTNGSTAVPSLIFGTDVNTGMFRPALDAIGFATNNTERLRIDANGRVGINGAPGSNTLNVMSAIASISGTADGITLTAQQNNGIGQGGAASLLGGNANSNTGGNSSVIGGSSNTGTGGKAFIYGGNANVSGFGGNAEITAGAALSAGTGGNVVINGGYTNSGTGGNVQINSGYGSVNYGNIELYPTNGKIILGTAPANGFASSGVCSIGSFPGVAGAQGRTCSGVPNGAVVHCSPTTSPGTIMWNTWASGAGTVTLILTGSLTSGWTCMWMKP